MKMFQYLNQKQMNNCMILFCVMDTVEEIVEEWDKHDNLTKEERKAIRTANTYCKKFLSLLQARIPDKEKGKLLKRYSNFSIKIMDEWLLSKFNKEMNEKGQTVMMDRKLFDVFGYELCKVKCKDCNASHSDCKLHDVLYENLYPYAGYKKNCPYAYHSKEALEEIARQEAEKEAKKTKKSKRAKNKKANRFDEDDEIIEFNFKPKNK